MAQQKLDAAPEEQVPDPSPDNGMVEIHEASIDDLDSALKNAQAEESGALPEEAAETPETQTLPPNGQPVSKETGVAVQGADPSKPARTYTQEEIQGILAENARHKKEGDQKELFIQHRGNELGKLRAELALSKRQLAETRAQLASGLEDRFAENPVQASNDRDRIKEIDQQIGDLDGQEERASKIVEAQTLFLRHVDTEKVNLDEVAEILKLDGVEDRFVAQFKANPWEFTTPEALVQMGKRAMDRKEFSTADNDRRLLAKHVLHLNAELEKLKGKPRQVMQQVQRNLNQAPNVNSQSSSTPKTTRDVDPTRMSIAELDAALRHASSH